MSVSMCSSTISHLYLSLSIYLYNNHRTYELYKKSIYLSFFLSSPTQFIDDYLPTYSNFQNTQVDR